MIAREPALRFAERTVYIDLAAPDFFQCVPVFRLRRQW